MKYFGACMLAFGQLLAVVLFCGKKMNGELVLEIVHENCLRLSECGRRKGEVNPSSIFMTLASFDLFGLSCNQTSSCKCASSAVDLLMFTSFDQVGITLYSVAFALVWLFEMPSHFSSLEK